MTHDQLQRLLRTCAELRLQLDGSSELRERVDTVITDIIAAISANIRAMGLRVVLPEEVRS